MITSRPFSRSTSASAAGAARARLLQDREMRRNKPDFAGPSRTAFAALTATFALPTTEPDIACLPLDAERLSPDEQQQRALQIARSLKAGYLSDIVYLPERQLAMATVRPILAQRRGLDAPHRICVDPEGNVSVRRLGEDGELAPRQLAMVRLLLVLGAVLSALGALSALTLTQLP